MSQTQIEPHPGLEIRPDEQGTLPLASFQLYVIVEPYQEAWAQTQAEEAQYIRQAGRLVKTIKAELDTQEDQTDHPEVLWIKNRQFPYANPLIEVLGGLPISNLVDQGNLEHLAFMVTGISILHPEWRAGVFGAAQQLEVIRVGNVIQTNGLWTTVLTRYCYPSQILQPYLTSV